MDVKSEVSDHFWLVAKTFLGYKNKIGNSSVATNGENMYFCKKMQVFVGNAIGNSYSIL